MRSYLFKTPTLLKRLYPGLIWDKYQKGDKSIYLTFDDGPIPEVTPWVLEQLAVADVKATFFVVGDNVRKYPEILREVIARGHQIGNHTFNHLNGWKTKDDDYLANVTECDEVLKAQGVDTKLFRPPYGNIRRSQVTKLKDAYDIVMWDYLTGDFDQKLSATRLIYNFKRKIVPGSVVVFHDNVKSFDVLQEALPEFLSYFKKQGYHFSTL